MNKDNKTNKYEKSQMKGTDGTEFTDALFKEGGMLELMNRDNNIKDVLEDK